jgi:membrane associated rhomboid family serine protease
MGIPWSYAILTYLIIGVTTIVSFKAFKDPVLKNRLLFNPYLVKNQKKYDRMLGHGLIHANQIHLIFNMLGLFFFGRYVEATLSVEYGMIAGKVLFMVLYLGSMMFASVPALRKHSHNPGYNSLGASGAVSAVLMGFVVIMPVEKVCLYGILCLPGYIMAILFFIGEQYYAKKGGTGIAHDAHIWGGLFGVIFFVVLDYHYLIDFFKQIAAHPFGY